jgi:predicted DNA-binding transcriptional regulator AlpA
MDMNVQPKANQVDSLLRAPEAAKLLGVSTSWLAKARLRGDGPQYTKIGRSVRYAHSSLMQFIKSRTRISTSEA